MSNPRLFVSIGILVAALLLPALSSGCGADPLPGPDPAWLKLELGDPVPGLSDEEMASFERGRALFTRVFRPEGRPGPDFRGQRL